MSKIKLRTLCPHSPKWSKLGLQPKKPTCHHTESSNWYHSKCKEDDYFTINGTISCGCEHERFLWDLRFYCAELQTSDNLELSNIDMNFFISSINSFSVKELKLGPQPPPIDYEDLAEWIGAMRSNWDSVQMAKQ